MSIKLETVSYSCPGLSPLRGISLEVDRGDFVGIIGSPGSGKSSLLLLMSGLAVPESGKVCIGGRDMAAKPGKGDRTAVRPAILTPESREQFFEQSLVRELMLSLKNTSLSKDERRERAVFWLEKLGFDGEKQQSSPLRLSAGERQRLAIAALLVREPEIILMDEPFAALDDAERHQLMELLRELNENGTTIVLSTGESQLISQYARRVLLMEHGRIVREGSAKSVFTDYYELIRREIPVPMVRECCQQLREQGVNMPANIILYDQFIDRLKIIMWRKER